MEDDLVYSPKKHIPLFSPGYNEDGEQIVVYYYARKKLYQEITVERLIGFLIDMEPLCDSKGMMIYLPGSNIPIMKMRKDSRGSIVEVKDPKSKEREDMKLSDYTKRLFYTNKVCRAS